MLTRVYIAVLLFLFARTTMNFRGEELGRSAAANHANPVPVSETITNQPFERSFILNPTAIAPFAAKGSAEVKSGSIALHLSALGQGNYVRARHP